MNNEPIKQTQTNPIAERVKSMQSVYLQRNMKKNAAKGHKKTKPKQTQFSKRLKMNLSFYSTEDYENKHNWTISQNKPNQTQFFTPLFRVLYTLRGPVFCPLSSVHGQEHKGKEQTEEFTQVLLAKYRWKITPAAVIFNPIKKLTTTRMVANLKFRRVIWRFGSLLIWGIGTYF